MAEAQFLKAVVGHEGAVCVTRDAVGEWLIVDDVRSAIIDDPAVAVVSFYINQISLASRRHLSKVLGPARVGHPGVSHGYGLWLEIVILDCASVALVEIFLADY